MYKWKLINTNKNLFVIINEVRGSIFKNKYICAKSILSQGSGIDTDSASVVATCTKVAFDVVLKQNWFLFLTQWFATEYCTLDFLEGLLNVVRRQNVSNLT